MPLVNPDYYTLGEALDLIEKGLPGENPLENLRQALHSRPSAAWIIDGNGRRVEIPLTLWLSFSLKFHLTFSIERGTARFVAPGANPYIVPAPVVEGQIRIDRGQLDELIRACKPPLQGVVSTINAETNCKRWLKQEVEAGSKKKQKGKYLSEAKDQFGVSETGFRHIWSEVVPEGWKKAGRPKSSR